ncbi:MAG: hypothetical protein RLZZ507_3322 [Cyanobacteriota bacterium]|jgi:hypothetical protein
MGYWFNSPHHSKLKTQPSELSRPIQWGACIAYRQRKTVR